MASRGGLRAVPAAQIDESIRPFKDYAEQYFEMGWLPFPLPALRKSPPKIGYTGRAGKEVTWAKVKEWLRTEPDDSNIGLRVSRFAFGVDVDHYDEKTGGSTLKLLADASGIELPETYVSSARVDGTSGIRYFAFPEGAVGSLLPSDLGAGIEVIQFHHRYAVAPPSIHPEFARHYRWYKPGQQIDGSGTFEVPNARLL